MSRQNIFRNFNNNSYNHNMSTININFLSNRHESTNDKSLSQDSNSSSDINSSLQENSRVGNFIPAEHFNYNNENVEGNEDELLNNFDITIININKTN